VMRSGKVPKRLKKYNVTILRDVQETATVEIEAVDENEAERTGYDVCTNLNYDQGAVEHTVQRVIFLGEVSPARSEGIQRFLEANEFEDATEFQDLVQYLRLDGKSDEEVLRGLHVYKAWSECNGPPKYSDVRLVLDGFFHRRNWGTSMNPVFDAAEQKYEVQG
jgi:hypothetical protein